MKKVFSLLLLLPALCFAQTTGFFVRSNCASITTPYLSNGIVCQQTTTTGGRTAGREYVWNGSAWVDRVSFPSDPTNCSAGNYPLGIDANGNVQNCTAASGGGTVTGTGSAGQVSFWTGASAISGDAGLTWDNTGKTAAVKSANTSCAANQFTVLDTDFSASITNGVNLIQCGATGFGSIQNGAGTLFTANLGQHIDLIYPDRNIEIWPAGEAGFSSFISAIPPSGTTYSQHALKLFARRDSGNGYVNPELDFHAWDGTDTALGFELAMEGTQTGTALSAQHFYLYDYQAAATVFSYNSATSTWTFFQQLSMDTGKGIFAQGGVFGGGAANSTLLLQSTTGVGTTDSVSIKTGNNGANTALTANTAGTLTVPSLTASKCVRTDASKVLSSSADDCLTSSTAVTSIAKSGSTALHGDVTLSGTTGNIDLTQASQDININVGSTVVQTDQANTWSTGAQSMASATSLVVPSSGGAAPTADGSIAYDTTADAWSVGGGDGNNGRLPRIVAQSCPAEQKTNNTTNDQDYTAIYTIPANTLIAGKAYRVTLMFQVVSDGAASNWTNYVKLGSSTKANTGAASALGNNLTRNSVIAWTIFGSAAAGASVNVYTSDLSDGNAAAVYRGTVTQPVAFATNGNLAITPGTTAGTNTNGESNTLLCYTVEELRF